MLLCSLLPCMRAPYSPKVFLIPRVFSLQHSVCYSQTHFCCLSHCMCSLLPCVFSLHPMRIPCSLLHYTPVSAPYTHIQTLLAPYNHGCSPIPLKLMESLTKQLHLLTWLCLYAFSRVSVPTRGTVVRWGQSCPSCSAFALW